MSTTTAKEKFANFLSYVKFFAFIVGIGVVGFYFYNHYQKNKPASTAGDATSSIINPLAIATSAEQKPSQLLNPVMASNLPVLLNDFSDQPVALQANFAVLEEIVSRERTQPGKLQPAWNIANQLCLEMRRLVKDRNAAAATLSQQQISNGPVSVTPKSKVEEQELASKQEFFKRVAAQRWTSTVPQRKKKIETIYQQLVNMENQAGK